VAELMNSSGARLAAEIDSQGRHVLPAMRGRLVAR
jgi:hypothetical protein